MNSKKYNYSFDKPFYMGRHTVQKSLMWSHVTELHFHAGLEILGVVSGQARLLVGNRTVKIEQNSIIFLDPVILHELAGNLETDVVVAHLSTESVVRAHFDTGDMTLLKPFVATHSILSPVLSNQKEAVQTLVDAHNYFSQSNPFDKLMAWNRVVEVLIGIARQTYDQMCEVSESRVGNISLITRAVEKITDTYQQNIPVDQLAEDLGTSTSNLSHRFKKHIGQSIVDYRNRLRISQAIDELRSSSFKIIAIAKNCGFNNKSQFFREFKKVTGKTPDFFRPTA